MSDLFLVLAILSIVAIFALIIMLITKVVTHKPHKGIGALIFFFVVCVMVVLLMFYALSQDGSDTTSGERETVSTEDKVESPETERKVDESTTEETTESVDTSVTYDEIYSEFKRNELNAKDLYNGKRYQITAKINGMETGGVLNLTGGATLTMEYKVDNTIVFFLAEFEKEQEDTLKQISVGDTVTFIGTCYNGTFSDCELQ